MEDIIAGSSEAIDSNLSQALAFTSKSMAKVSPALLRRRSPSPMSASASLGSSGGGGNTSSSSGTSAAANKSEQFLAVETDGKGKSISQQQSSSSSTENPQQLTVPSTAGALSKSPSAGSDVPGKANNKGKGQAKKKSWYSVFYPSYKSRSADYKKLFKDVPDDERLLVGK